MEEGKILLIGNETDILHCGFSFPLSEGGKRFILLIIKYLKYIISSFLDIPVLIIMLILKFSPNWD